MVQKLGIKHLGPFGGLDRISNEQLKNGLEYNSLFFTSKCETDMIDYEFAIE